jgi:hypothetical protein
VAASSKLFEELIDGAERQPFAGRDFSYLRDRMVEAPLPWDYLTEVRERLNVTQNRKIKPGISREKGVPCGLLWSYLLTPLKISRSTRVYDRSTYSIFTNRPRDFADSNINRKKTIEKMK